MHKLKYGLIKPFAHASRAILPAEKHSVIEKESLGIVFTLKKFHRFFHRRMLTIQTDHSPLLAILGSKIGLMTHAVNRLQRWGTILLYYDFRMEFLPSSKLCHVDGLSILIPKQSKHLEDAVIVSLRADVET